MDHATSYQHCTQPDEPNCAITQPPELHMLKHFATEIGVIVGHIESDKEFSPGAYKLLAAGHARTLRRIRKGIEIEIANLAALLAERDL